MSNEALQTVLMSCLGGGSLLTIRLALHYASRDGDPHRDPGGGAHRGPDGDAQRGPDGGVHRDPGSGVHRGPDSHAQRGPDGGVHRDAGGARRDPGLPPVRTAAVPELENCRNAG